jgi:hypothetical protein
MGHTQIKLRRGLEEDLPVLKIGEPAFTLDTGKLFVGSASGNVEISGGSGGGSGGATNFLSLTDTPSDYTGYAGQVPIVNAGETALEFGQAFHGGSIASALGIGVPPASSLHNVGGFYNESSALINGNTSIIGQLYTSSNGFIDADLGVGTSNPKFFTSPARIIEASYDGDGFPVVTLSRTNGVTNRDSEWSIFVGTGGALSFRDTTNSRTPMTFDENGRMGVGQTSINAQLEVKTFSASVPSLKLTELPGQTSDYLQWPGGTLASGTITTASVIKGKNAQFFALVDEPSIDIEEYALYCEASPTGAAVARFVKPSTGTAALNQFLNPDSTDENSALVSFATSTTGTGGRQGYAIAQIETVFEDHNHSTATGRLVFKIRKDEGIVVPVGINADGMRVGGETSAVGTKAVFEAESFVENEGETKSALRAFTYYSPSAAPGTVFPGAFTAQFYYNSTVDSSGFALAQFLDVRNTDTGVINARCFDINYQNNSTGTADYVRLINLRAIQGNVTDKYAIYQSGGDDTNYFAGGITAGSPIEGNRGAGTINAASTIRSIEFAAYQASNSTTVSTQRGDGVRMTMTAGATEGLFAVTTNNPMSLWANNTRRIYMGTDGDFYPATDNFSDLGRATRRWDDIYATNGTIQTSDKRLKKHIRKSPLGLEFITKLNPIRYTWKNSDLSEDYTDNDAQTVKTRKLIKKHSRSHYGFISQDVKKTIDELGVDFAGFIEGDDEEKMQGLRYTEFIAPMVKAIQELTEIVQEQQNQIDQLTEDKRKEKFK